MPRMASGLPTNGAAPLCCQWVDNPRRDRLARLQAARRVLNCYSILSGTRLLPGPPNALPAASAALSLRHNPCIDERTYSCQFSIFYGKGVTKDKYDVMIGRGGLKDNHPAGGIFHAARSRLDGDAHAADIWESEEALNAYFASLLAPVFEKHQHPGAVRRDLPCPQHRRIRASISTK